MAFSDFKNISEVQKIYKIIANLVEQEDLSY